MKERPVLFSTPMIKAILNNSKTQTRRTVKFPRDFDGKEVFDNSPFGLKYTRADTTLWRLFCKYGQIGNILWVRETWNIQRNNADPMEDFYCYKADNPNYLPKWKPSIFMPKEACRIRLLITDVRVERVQDISEEDAKAEGATNPHVYRDLWEKINGKDSWNKNPWVWCISFRRI